MKGEDDGETVGLRSRVAGHGIGDDGRDSTRVDLFGFDMTEKVWMKKARRDKVVRMWRQGFLPWRISLDCKVSLEELGQVLYLHGECSRGGQTQALRLRDPNWKQRKRHYEPA